MKFSKLNLLGVAATALPLLMTGTVSFAGNVLRMNAGDIRLENNMVNIKDLSYAPKYFVVQFKNVITEINKQDLRAQGLEPRGYLPDDALLVKGFDRDAQALSLSPEINAVVPFQPEWKVSSELISSTSKSELIHIATLSDEDTSSVLQELNLIPGVKIKGAASKSIVVRAQRAAIGEIAKIEGIEWIQVFPVFMTFDFAVDANETSAPTTPPAITGYESGTKLMNFEAAWARGYKGEGQWVGMADTGVDNGNPATIIPDLKGVLKGYPMGFGADSWDDSNGHGTHVCGSVISNGSASNGAIRGGAYSAQMVVDGLWSPIMDNLAFNNDFNALLGKPYADGVRIHTNSWGSPQNPGAYDSFAVKADSYMWEHPDMLVLFAAGNDGKDLDKNGRIDEGSVSTPATAKNVLTVGASENLLAQGGIQKPIGQLRDGDKKWGAEPIKSDTLSNNSNGIACFSSRGPTQDGRLKPEIVAPGTNIVSTRSTHPKAGPLWGEYDKNYAYAGGTSMATPLTAGAAVVAREYLIKAQKIANPSAALVKATLMHTAKDLYPGQYGTGPQQELPTQRPNVHEGYGRVDMDQATNLQNTKIIDDTVGVAVNQENSVSVNVAAGKSLRVTLSYTDAPGSASAAKALVNDLDVQVVAPSRKVTTLADRTNNSEMIEMSNLSVGTYQVVVKGINIPQGKNGKQPYALLITQY